MDYDEYSARHPLSGEVGARPATKEALPSSWSRHVAELLCVVLLVALLGALLNGVRQAKAIRALQSTLDSAKGEVVYEPLSKAGDGSYKEGQPGGKSRDVLQRLKGWRKDH
jgi:hypothetical protein